MDTQRALSLTRHHAKKWDIDPDRVGVLGFSAGGETAGRTAMLNGKRLYQATDDADKKSCAVNFAVLVYAAGLVGDDNELKKEIEVDSSKPPVFFAHAADDRVKAENSIELFLALNRSGVKSELHVYQNGGHGYGLRKAKTRVTGWPKDAHGFLDELGFLKK